MGAIECNSYFYLYSLDSSQFCLTVRAKNLRILIQSNHTYPACNGGPGGGRVFDHLIKGLAELGHQVIYYLEDNLKAPLPTNVSHTKHPLWNADIYHVRSDSMLSEELTKRKLPWVATCHTDPDVWGLPRDVARSNWISVSRTLANSLEGKRFVLNGIDPGELSYSEEKDRYLLFVSTSRLAWKKGLTEAIELAQVSQSHLFVAGSDADLDSMERVRNETETAGMTFLGEISGQRKSRVFAKARALLFPTKINEAFGLVIAEAMMSGTPVICSAKGACSELVSPHVGFVCNTREEYLRSIEHIEKISPQQCRSYAMEKFHYLRMAKDYVKEYQKELHTFR